MRDEPKKRVRLRIITLLVFFYLGFLCIGFRTYQLQVMRADKLQAIARQQYLRKFALKSPRGVIYDRNHAELAVNKRGYSIARTEKVRNPKMVSEKLSQVLGMDQARLERKLKEDDNFVWVARQVDEAAGEAVKVLELQGIVALPEERRFYPGGELSGQVIGLTGLDGEGLEGLEKYYDSELRGKSRYLTVERDNRGAMMMRQDEDEKNFQPGSLVLTIDQALQHLAEQKVKEAVLKYKARRGCMVAADPKTGKILALAVYPGFDPNRYSDYKGHDWRNWPLTDVYEPGSTFKVITFSSAMEEGKLDLTENIDCQNGEMQVGDDTLHDMHKFGILSTPEVIIHSSNIGAAKIAVKTGPTGFRKHIIDFGFGAKTGMDLPGEARGLVRPVKEWYPVTLRTIGFGQGISITPVQMLMALSAVANGGELLKPYIAEKIVYPDGTERILNRPVVVRRAIAPQTASTITGLMVRVVNEGTGRNAQIPGYQAAGKTGTAQKSRVGAPGYDPTKWVCSFMGFAPADNPKIAAIVLIDEPEADWATGGLLAAPVFQEVMKYGLTTMGVLPGDIANQPYNNVTSKLEMDPGAKRNEVKPSAEPGKIPDLKGLGLKEALKLSLELKQEPMIEGTGWVVSQSPEPGSALTGKVTLKLSDEGI